LPLDWRIRLDKPSPPIEEQRMRTAMQRITLYPVNSPFWAGNDSAIRREMHLAEAKRKP